jgi:GT2 family glycosyltransferase
MTSLSAPSADENPPESPEPTMAAVRVLVTVVEGADLQAALGAVGRQAYQPAPEVAVVGAAGEDLAGGVTYATLEEAIAATEESVDYLWILHSDARPRPDALAALVREVERNDASLGGSKLLVAGSRDVLEEVGSATDVFGEPYSGLEYNEIDLQQYDVVREVAFVRSASMLVRRDLAQGLRGLDVRLPPVAAGLDFSQRTRLAGGAVISVPSSEVYHQGRCHQGVSGWREQAGRMRAMLTAYRPLTLAWVIPYDMLVSIIDSVANLLLLRWRPLVGHLMSWLWNLANLPSTIRHRRRLNRVRVTGDEDLFRFQARGSVRLRVVGSELSARVLSMFDDDETLARRTRVFMSSPGIWGAIVATIIALLSARSFFLSGVPNVGLSFPFEPAMVSLDRWFAGWNDSGLGSPAPVHPSVLTTAIATLAAFGATGSARTMLIVAIGVVGIAGMGRLGGRLGLRGPGRYLAGLVLLGGPGTALLTGNGSWTALGAAAFLPWAVRAVLIPSGTAFPWRRLGWAILLGLALATFSPILAVVPLAMTLVIPGEDRRRARVVVGLAALGAVVVALPFLLGDPGWIVDASRRLMLAPATTWTVILGVAALTFVGLENPWRRVGLTGVALSLAASVALLLPIGGVGVEEALLVLASFGAALAAATGLDMLSTDFRRVLALAPAIALLFLSVAMFGNGRYGLPPGDFNDDIGFAAAVAGEGGPGRILLASTVRDDIPGEAIAGPGFWYRLVDGGGMTHDEVWLAPARAGERALAVAIEQLTIGDQLRPGELLAPFAIEWLILMGPEFRLDAAMLTQVDMVRTPFDPVARHFENTSSLHLAAGDGVVWGRSGAGFAGEPHDGPIRLAVNQSSGWAPDPFFEEWAVEVDGTDGAARYRGSVPLTIFPAMTILLLVSALAFIVRGRAS